MKVITVSDTSVTSNMVRGVFAQKKVPGVEFVHVNDQFKLLAALDDNAVVLIDWEGDPAKGAEYVYASKEKSPKFRCCFFARKSRLAPLLPASRLALPASSTNRWTPTIWSAPSPER